MVKIDQLVEDVHRAHLAFGKNEVSREDVRDIVQATLRGCGLYVNSATGEVYDPAPKPVNIYPQVPRQTGVRWAGSGRRRRGGRR